MISRILQALFAAALLAIALPASPAAAQEKPKKAPTPKLTDQAIRSEQRLYRKAPEGELFVHLYFPADWKREDARPAIVFFFGGGWKNGSYRQFVPQAEYFASRGLVAACADYRIESKHKTTPDQCVEDAKSAIRWVRAHAKELGVHPGKIIASGGSAGGHLAAAVALLDRFNAPDDDVNVDCKPNALVLFNPALNLTLPAGRTIVDGKGNDITKPFSPTLSLSKSAPPAIIFFGTADKLLTHGEEYAAKAKKLGVRGELYTALDMPHGFFNRSPWTEVTAQKADEFLASLGYLQGPPTVKLPAGAPGLEKR
ncbi:MAG: alpha/beta hydrolase [Gemmataceae bacterium]|nr:alpha/beta hydrolase [Gemmataceae bacterium]